MKKELIFWNVDTQKDFMYPNGKLPVADALSIVENLGYVTNVAKNNMFRVVNTRDWHAKEDAEISDNPDYITTYNEHCMADTDGAEYIPETAPLNPYVVGKKKENLKGLLNSLNIVLNKDKFDVFSGNANAYDVVRLLNPQAVVVYGVATNVCVNHAVLELTQQVPEVYVITNAIKHLPHLEDSYHPLYNSARKTIEAWKNAGAKMIRTFDLENIVGQYK